MAAHPQPKAQPSQSSLGVSTLNGSQLTVHPNGSQFAPRREFIRDQHTFSTFTLLALSGTSAVRLYSFPTSFINILRHHLQQSKLLANFREDTAQSLCEFTLEGRPWAIAKSVKTEKLIVEIITLVFRHGFTFLSTIDYGREQDDRIALAFSRPASGSGSRSASPLPGAVAQAPPPQMRATRVPFAISFSSATVMRVINPPLNSTPAILQAVRGSWPRGVVDEKKVGETCFEFKLKGYKWFQEDTFATDSLRHILTLLAALDVHGFKLMSSLTLTNRSRIKDLWMFTGPAHEHGAPESPTITPNQSTLDLKRHETPESSGVRHMRSSSAPGNSSTTLGLGYSPHTPTHQRTATDSSPNKPSISGSGSTTTGLHAPRVLRKPSPKFLMSGTAASSSGSLVRSPLPMSSSEPIRMSLASEVGSAENMTGIGISRFRFPEAEDTVYNTPRMEMQRPRMPVTEVIYETGGESGSRDTSPSPFMQEEDPFRREMPSAAPMGGRALPTPPMMPPHTEQSPSPPYTVPEHNTPVPGDVTPHREQSPSPPLVTPSVGASGRRTPLEQPRTPSPPTAHSSTLLSPGMFRNSAFTTSTGWRSTEIPIQWNGPLSAERDSAVNPRAGHDSGVGMVLGPGERDRASSGTLATPGPKLPGAWMLTPVDEHTDDPMASQTRLSTLPAPAGPRQPGETPRNSPSPPAVGEPGGPPIAAWQLGPRVQTPEKHKVDARVSSPAVAAGLARKSEAGVVGLMPAVPTPLRAPLPTPPTAPRSQERISPPPPAPVFPREPRTAPSAGDGWVLVDIDTKDPHQRRTPPPHGQTQRPPPRPRSTSDSFINPRRTGSPPVHSSGGGTKATLTVGTVDASRDGPPGHAQKRMDQQQQQSGIRRLFSLSRDGPPGELAGKKGRRQSAGEQGLERFGSDSGKSGRNMFGRRKQQPPQQQGPVRQRVKLD